MLIKILKLKYGKRAYLKCDSCDLEFPRSFSRVNIHKNHFCSFKCCCANKEFRSGVNHGRWKGGRVKVHGYVYILKPDHPFCNKQGYFLEHRLVMEKSIGRYLTPKEVVHHVNGIKDDNREENLTLFKNQSEHHRYLHLIFSNKLSNLQICWKILKNQTIFN